MTAPTAERHEKSDAPDPRRHLAGLVLAVFLLTFIASRVMVYLIMSHRVPDLYLHVGGNHVHHLNYGIFLLTGVGAYLIFARPKKRGMTWASVFYAIGLGLTFDEFGMWVHLGGAYWQRSSYDAIVVIASALGLVAAAPSIKRFERRHWVWGGVLLVALAAFVVLLVESAHHAGKRLEPKLLHLEEGSPR